MERPGVVIWDFGGTIAKGSRLVTDAREVLEVLHNKDFKQVIATCGGVDQIRERLKLYEIDRYFELISGLGQVCNDDVKDYVRIATDLGLTVEEATRRFIVIGDREDDAPIGVMEGVVFIHNENEEKKSLFVVADIIYELVKRSSNNFPEAFRNLFRDSEQIWEGILAEAQLPNGITFRMSYSNGRSPTISRINMPSSYEKIPLLGIS